MSVSTQTDSATAPQPRTLMIDTPEGMARAHVYAGQPGSGAAPARAPHGAVILGHGAGPSITTVDLVAARDALVAAGWTVVIVEQPWLVAGKKIAPRPKVLDAAWVPIVATLRAEALADVTGPLVVGGRSAGARVACRNAATVGADGVLALSFPFHPPGKPAASRGEELLAPLQHGIPVVVVQGENDPFGTPEELTAYLDEVGGAAAGELRPALSAVPGTHTIPPRAREAIAQAVVAGLEHLRGHAPKPPTAESR